MKTRLTIAVLFAVCASLYVPLVFDLQGQDAAPAEGYDLKLNQLTDDAVSWTVTIQTSVGLMNQLMAIDLNGNQEYLQRIRAARGEEARRSAEVGLRSPYEKRIREIVASGQPSLPLNVRMVSLGGQLSFSAVSFDGSFQPKDPVSVLFYGGGNVDAIYSELTRGRSCTGADCGKPVSFLDHDGVADAGGLRPCHSQTQWVLMATGDGPLQWHRNTRGLMVDEGGCASGTRDHIRLFGEMSDGTYGSWFVATPHREEWTNNGHVVKSWQAPARAFVEAWTASSESGGFRTNAVSRAWAFCDARSDGLYQGIHFNGEVAVIAIP